MGSKLSLIARAPRHDSLRTNVRRSWLAPLGLVAAAVLLSAAPAFSQVGNGTLPGMRFYDAEQLTPTAAWTNYYQGATSAVTYAWGSNKPWEIKETARALENDPQKIFAFVKNHIRFEPRFGAQKGAVGAIIDRSGTAFDQAQLLVELLRAAGFTARYQVGTLSLSGTEFVSWIGISDPTAAAQFLANGGIPAQVSGSGTVSNVTMAHAWVTVQIGASSVILDPSYKVMDRWSQIDVATDSGLPASFAATATTPTASGTEPSGVPYITGVNLTGAASQLDAAANLLLTKLRTTYKDKRSDEVMGGERIHMDPDPWAHKTTGALDASWGTYEDGLPDKYRTKLNAAAANCRANLFVDEIYGRRLVFHSRTYAENGPPWEIHVTGQDGFAINEKAMPGTVPGQSGDCVYTPAVDGVSIAVDLPYAARAAGSSIYGSWMDRTSVKEVNFGADIQIVHGWGDASSELQSRLGDDFILSVPWSVDGSGILGPGAGEYYGPPMSGAPLGPATGNAKLYGAWLAQMTRANHLLEGISRTKIQHHYTIGVVYTQIQRHVNDSQPRNGMDDGEDVIAGSVWDSATRINIDSGFSTTSLTGLPAEKLATRQTIAALGAMLEGSMYEQQQDAVDTISTARRFPWGQENLASTIHYGRLLQGSGVVPEYRGGASSTYGATCKGQNIANAGYVVVQPNDRYLGPGTTRPWPLGAYNGIWPFENRAPQSDPHMHRGCAWIAFNADGSEIAHVVTSIDRELKGAGGPSKKDAADRAPTMQADLLKDIFKDRSNMEGVDLRTGGFTYRPAADVVVGQGDFPYALSFQRIFQMGGPTCPKCTPGWTHNLDIRASMSGGGLEGMGQSTPLALASPLVALKGVFEVYKADGLGLANHVAAAGVMRWLADRLTYNVVTVNMGASSETFVRVADGSFAAPPSSQSTLVQTGQRRSYYELAGNLRHGRSSIWLYDQIALTRTSGSGDVIWFGGGVPYNSTVSAAGGWREWNPTESTLYKNEVGSLKGFAQGFFANTWTFPQGVTLTFTYCTDPPIIYGGEPGIPQTSSLSLACADRLEKVASNLGPWLKVDGLNVESSDGRTASVTQGIDQTGYAVTDFITPIQQRPLVVTGAVDVSGKRRVYDWKMPAASDRPTSSPRLWRVWSPVDYSASGSGADVCPNVAGIQTSVPPGMVKTGGVCVAVDLCPDIPGAQTNNSQCPPAVNHPPVATDNAYTIYRLGNQLLDPYVNPIGDDSDPDNDTISYSGVPADFSLQSDNRLNYSNIAFTDVTPGVTGPPRTYTYSITDPHGATASATISVQVPNRPPVTAPDSKEWDVSTGDGFLYPLENDYDPDGLPLTITGTTAPGGTFTSTRIRLMQMTVGGSYDFTYTVSDGLTSVTQNAHVTVVNTDGCRVGQICN
ncbi:MAG: Ig-like domain-containing protein [Phenylobacterium sp.]|uniref:Ig-like domain-containing protein n=1 Tax=Phenylobacterium sp. TaxID=1871053 RepID=UPI003BB6D1FA